MGLRFLIGRAGTGKSDYLLEEIKNELKTDPQGPSIYYIAPDQMTFDQEYTLFNDESLQGSIRAQVFSFSRLAWRVFQATGGSTRQFISSVGIQMILRKIVEEREANWNVFQKAQEKQGFLSQLENMITEFKRYEITPELLHNQIEQINKYTHQTTGEKALTSKLDDLLYIYEKLTYTLQDQYIDKEDQLQLLAEKINETSLFDDADIYFDGFHGFTPKELLVIEALMKKCRRVTIALTIDTEDINDRQVSELDLFHETRKTYEALHVLAMDNQISIEEPVVLDSKDGKFSNKPYFAHLEQYFDELPSPEFNGEVPIQIAEAVHPRAEVEGAAQEIIRLVREQGYRYQDIAIFIRESDVYHDLISTIFRDYNIPVFVDEKRTMLNHSLIEFVRSVFDIVESNWRYDAVFRVLKTGFIRSTNPDYPLTNDAIDELENYVLEYGIRSREQWIDDQEWVFQRFRGFDQAVQTNTELAIQKRLNKYRDQVGNSLKKFDKQIREAKTIRDLCEVTYTLLEDLEVTKRLEAMRNFYDERGNIEKGREQEQVWSAIIQLFDELVEVVGDEQMDVSTFRATLEAGFESLEFAHVPPSIDHVIVGTVDHSRISQVKCAFLFGVNEGSWPMKPPIDGMISDQEREILAGHGLQLAESNERKLLDDWFYMYKAFTTAEDQLWISYPLSDEEGKTKLPSQLIKRIQALFPICNDIILLQDPDDLLEADRFISTPFKTRAALTAQLARNQNGYPMKPIWLHVLNWYIANHSKQSTTYNVLQSLYYANIPSYLSAETVEQLYPKQVKTSVSRLETFYKCSYQHFVQYSLGLEERKTYQLDAPDIGQLFHEALKIITEWIQKEQKDFAHLTKNDTNTYARRAVENLAPILQHQILHSSNRYKYIQQKLQEVIARATHILSQQAKYSDFSPVGIELGFGENEVLQPVTISLPNGFELVLRGRIDRIDKAQNQEELYLRIIDYKSSARGLSLIDVYYGIALQMLTYLDVVLSQSEQWLGLQASPAGILYFHVHNAMISKTKNISDDKLIEEIFKNYKMEGLLLSNEEIVRMMDTSLESGTSQIIPAGVKKNGGFYARSKVAGEETFSNLQTHINNLIVRAGINMTSGHVDLNPYEHKQQTACTFCPFHSVCQFDHTLKENNYRQFVHMKDDEILEKLSKGDD